jgi:hypothetical protein
MTAAKGVDENAQKKKQFFMLEKTDYMENMLGALQNMANLMDGPMEIDTRERFYFYNIFKCQFFGKANAETLKENSY